MVGVLIFKSFFLLSFSKPVTFVLLCGVTATVVREHFFGVLEYLVLLAFKNILEQHIPQGSGKLLSPIPL